MWYQIAKIQLRVTPTLYTARQTRRVSQQSADHVSKPRYEKSPLLRFGMKECTYGLDGFLVLVQMHTRGVGDLWGHTCVFQMALANWFSGSLPRSGMLEIFMNDAHVVAHVAFFESWFCDHTQNSMKLP